MRTIDISGFSGGYEATYQAMLIAGIKWLKEHPSFTFQGYKAYCNITGIMVPPDTELAKELDDVLLKAAQGDMTGAQHQVVISHLAYIQAHGYEQWIEDAKKKVDEADIERQVTAQEMLETVKVWGRGNAQLGKAMIGANNSLLALVLTGVAGGYWPNTPESNQFLLDKLRIAFQMGYYSRSMSQEGKDGQKS